MILVATGCDSDSGGSSGPADGVNITGTWKGMSSDGIAFTTKLIQQPNGALAGTITRQEGWNGSVSGQVNGTEFHIHVIWGYGGTGDYDGDIIGNAIEGTSVERSGSQEWRGTFTALKQ